MALHVVANSKPPVLVWDCCEPVDCAASLAALQAAHVVAVVLDAANLARRGAAL